MYFSTKTCSVTTEKDYSSVLIKNSKISEYANMEVPSGAVARRVTPTTVAGLIVL